MRFIGGSHSLNENRDLKSLEVFEVPEYGIDVIHSKLVMKIYDEYENTLTGMYRELYSTSVSVLVVSSRPPTRPLLSSLIHKLL